jgi:hypothetical protein
VPEVCYESGALSMDRSVSAFLPFCAATHLPPVRESKA